MIAALLQYTVNVFDEDVDQNELSSKGSFANKVVVQSTFIQYVYEHKAWHSGNTKLI